MGDGGGGRSFFVFLMRPPEPCCAELQFGVRVVFVVRVDFLEGGWRVEDVWRWRMEDGGRMEDGRWRMEDGG
jgi:hypothetical protein